jgi:hypothetical protein
VLRKKWRKQSSVFITGTTGVLSVPSRARPKYVMLEVMREVGAGMGRAALVM